MFKFSTSVSVRANYVVAIKTKNETTQNSLKRVNERKMGKELGWRCYREF